MKRTSPRWWSYVVHVVQDYPQLHAELESMRATSMTADYSGMPRGGGDPSDPVGSAAIRSLPRQEQKEHDAVADALVWIRSKPNGKQRMALVERVYFRRTHTLEGAAMSVGYAYGHARRLNQQFVHKVARNMGIEDENVS